MFSYAGLVVLPALLAALPLVVVAQHDNKTELHTDAAVPIVGVSATHYADWSHEPFNLKAYRESAALANETAHTNLTVRTDAITAGSGEGVYYCDKANWKGHCWWQPVKNQCVNVYVPRFSIGPDMAIACFVFSEHNCVQSSIRDKVWYKPGGTPLPGVKSWRCYWDKATGQGKV